MTVCWYSHLVGRPSAPSAPAGRLAPVSLSKKDTLSYLRAATEHRVGTADESTALGPLVGTCCYLLQASALPRFSSSRRVPSSFASESNQPILRPPAIQFSLRKAASTLDPSITGILRACVVLATRKQDDDTTHSTPQNSSLSHQAIPPSRPFTCLPTRPLHQAPVTYARSSELSTRQAPLPHHHHHHHLAAPGRIGTSWSVKKKKEKKKDGTHFACCRGSEKGPSYDHHPRPATCLTSPCFCCCCCCCSPLLLPPQRNPSLTLTTRTASGRRTAFPFLGSYLTTTVPSDTCVPPLATFPASP